MSATTLELPVVVDEPAAASSPALSAAPAAPAGRPRFRAVLAPLLPTLVLLGLCIAGLSDPPAPSADDAGDRGGQSRLHVPTEAPYLPAVPLTR